MEWFKRRFLFSQCYYMMHIYCQFYFRNSFLWRLELLWGVNLQAHVTVSKFLVIHVMWAQYKRVCLIIRCLFAKWINCYTDLQRFICVKYVDDRVLSNGISNVWSHTWDLWLLEILKDNVQRMFRKNIKNQEIYLYIKI